MLRPRTSSRTCPANTRYDSQSGLCVSETTDQDPDVVGKKRSCASPYQWISPTSDGKCVPKQPEDDERSKRCPAGQVFLSTIGCACPGGGNACKRRTVYYTRTPTEPAPAPEPAPVPEVQPEVCVTYTIQRRNPDRKIKSETSGTTRAPSTDELLEGDTIVFYLTTTPAEASKPVKQANVRYRYIRTGSGHQTVRPSPDPHRPKREMLNQYSNWNVYSVRVGGTEPRVKKFAVFTIKDDHRPDGSRIAYFANGFSFKDVNDGVYRYVHELFVAKPDGSNRIKIADKVGTSLRQLWSPDGSRIAYVAYETTDDTTDAVLFVVEPDGSGRIKIADNPNWDWWGWSPAPAASP